MSTINLSNLSAEELQMLQTQGERLLGFTLERAHSFLADSRTENPDKDEPWHLDDATGKFKHFLRNKRKWGGAVDAAWPHIKSYAREVVELAQRAERNTTEVTVDSLSVTNGSLEPAPTATIEPDEATEEVAQLSLLAGEAEDDESVNN